MNIVHKSEKNHNNINGLSRISINHVKVNFYSMTIINVNENFLKKFKNVLAMNFHFYVIYEKLQTQIAKTLKNVIYHSYRLNKDIELLYFVNRSNSNRICISVNLKKKFSNSLMTITFMKIFTKQLIDCVHQCTSSK